MTTQTFVVRLFGGRDVGVTYDSGAGTLAFADQSYALSTLSVALQAQFLAATGGGGSVGNGKSSGGDNMQAALGAIFDAQPVWRAAMMAAIATIPANSL